MQKASKEKRSVSCGENPCHQPAYKTALLKYGFAASISLLTFIIYLPSLRNEFVNWDDNLYIYENSFIRSLDAAFLKWAFFDFYAANWHPLTWISHAMDYAFWGLNPMGHHLTNNILHAINTFLVVLLVVKLMEAGQKLIDDKISTSSCNASRQREPSPSLSKRGSVLAPPLQQGDKGGFSDKSVLITAATTGLLFGLHPLHVESVAWVSERKNLLCALFFLLSILAYLKYASCNFLSFPLAADTSSKKDPGQAGMTRPGLRFFSKHYILSILFFALALMSKPMAVSLPAVLFILDWYPLERIRSLKSLWSVSIEKLPFIALSLLSATLTILAQKEVGAIQSVEKVPLFSRALIAFKSLIVYLWKMILPLNLVPFYPYPKNVSFLLPEYFLPVALVIVIITACLLVVRRQKLWLSCWGCYVIMLIPVLGIVQVGHQSIADRYAYLTDLGPFLLVGLAVARLSTTLYASKKSGLMLYIFGVAVAILIISSISYATIRQTGIWKNSISLWTRVIEREPSTYDLAYNNRGSAFNDTGQYGKALEDFNKAIALNPSYALSYRNRGSVFANMGRLDEAMADFNKSIALEPSASAYYLRGAVFDREGLIGPAIKDYEQAIALNPSYGSAYFDLGILYGKSGLIDKAIESFNKTIDIMPDHYLAYSNRGLAYSLIGQYEKALKDLDSAIVLNRAYADAYINRGNVYISMGKKELAVLDFRKACDLGNKEGCIYLQREP